MLQQIQHQYWISVRSFTQLYYLQTASIAVDYGRTNPYELRIADLQKLWYQHASGLVPSTLETLQDCYQTVVRDQSRSVS